MRAGAIRRAAGFLAALALLATPLAAASAPPSRIALRLGTVPDVGFMAVYVAMAKGFYRTHGLDVAYQAIPGGGKVNQALVTGAIDIGGIGNPDAAIAYLAGRPVRIVQALYTHEFIELIVRNQMRDRVRSVRDLKGLRIGVSSPGSVSWAFGHLFLADAGLDPATDASFVFVGAPTTMYAALRSGKIDVAAGWEPLTSTALAQHQGYVLASLLDPAEHQRLLGAPHSLALVALTTSGTIRSSPGLVRRFVAANRDAIAWVRGHSTAQLAQVLTGYFQDVSPEIMRRAVERRLVGLPQDGGSLSRAAYAANTRAALRAGVLKSVPPFSNLVDCAFVACEP